MEKYFYEGKMRDLSEIGSMCVVMNRQSRMRIVRDLCPVGGGFLDVGCGVGNLCDLLGYRHDLYVGYDLLEENIRIAKLLYGREFVDFTCDKSNIGKFDVIFALEVLEHQDNPGLFLQEWSGHLKSDGVLILSVPNLLGTTNSLFNFKHRKKIIEKYDFNGTESDHVVGWDRLTLQNLLVKNGFRIEEVRLSRNYFFKGQSIVIKARKVE